MVEPFDVAAAWAKIVGDAKGKDGVHVVRDPALLRRMQEGDFSAVPEGAAVPVLVHAVGKGAPTRNALLCLPLPADSPDARLAPAFDPAQPRAAIGLLTSAAYSFARAQGFGVGYVLASHLRRLPASGLALARNLTSPQYRWVRLRVATSGW